MNRREKIAEINEMIEEEEESTWDARHKLRQLEVSLRFLYLQKKEMLNIDS